MNKAYCFYLHEPFFQDPAVLNSHYKNIYSPLLKYIKTKSDFKCTIAPSLSFLETMDNAGYLDWINELKELIDKEKVELACTFAYNPNAKELSDLDIERQIILNEYGISYYLGQSQNFEDEDAYLIRDVKSFFVSGDVYDKRMVLILKELGYQYMVIDDYKSNSMSNDSSTELKKIVLQNIIDENYQLVSQDSVHMNVFTVNNGAKSALENENIIIVKKYGNEELFDDIILSGNNLQYKTCTIAQYVSTTQDKIKGVVDSYVIPKIDILQQMGNSTLNRDLELNDLIYMIEESRIALLHNINIDAIDSHVKVGSIPLWKHHTYKNGSLREPEDKMPLLYVSLIKLQTYDILYELNKCLINRQEDRFFIYVQLVIEMYEMFLNANLIKSPNEITKNINHIKATINT